MSATETVSFKDYDGFGKLPATEALLYEFKDDLNKYLAGRPDEKQHGRGPMGTTPVLDAEWLSPGQHVGFIREYEMSDDALARAAVDLGGRRGAEISLEEDPGLARHTLESLAQAARMTLHVEATGRDPHHLAEAACKAVGRALREAVRREGSELPSTKGLL